METEATEVKTAPKPTAATETPAALKKVIFDDHSIVAIGDYKPGVVYEVAAEEADRLIKYKCFRPATAADEAKQEVSSR